MNLLAKQKEIHRHELPGWRGENEGKQKLGDLG